MPPVHRIIEIVIYSLLNFAPYIIIALYPFRNKLRFSSSVTTVLVVCVTAVQIVLGLCAALFTPQNAGLISAVSTLLYFAFYFTAVKAHFGKTLFTLLMLSNIANFVVIASKCLENIFRPDMALQSYRWTFSLTMFCVELVVLIPLFLYIRRTYSDVFTIETAKSTWRFIWLIPATFYVVWYYHLYNNEMSSLEVALKPANTVFILIINLGALLVYHMVVEHIRIMDRNEKLINHTHQLEVQNLQYENLQDRIAEARQAKHDVRQHIQVMSALLEDKKYDELAQYLKGYNASLPNNRTGLFCEHYATNALLQYFAQQAMDSGIDFHANVVLPADIGIPDNVLSVVLGNLLENSLEASQQVTDCKRVIHVKNVYEGGSLLFKIKNPYTGELKRNKDGLYLSTKHADRVRGIGLSSVRSIVYQYNGMIEFEQKDGYFITTVMLMVP